MSVRVVIADDQPLFRAGLRTLLAARPGLVVVGEAGDGQEAVASALTLGAHVVLMDLKMPRLDGVAATRRMAVQAPAVRVVVLTTFEDDELVFEALRAGAVGYLLKDALPERVAEAILAAARGQSVLQPSVASKVLAELARRPSPPQPSLVALRLSDREVEVLRLVARGASNKEIGSALLVTEGTIKNHVTSILSKLGVGDRTQAALRARELGIV